MVVEALLGEQTIEGPAAKHRMHLIQITQRKKVTLEEFPQLMSVRRGANPKEEEARVNSFR